MSSEARRRVICRCLGVASPRVFEAARAGSLATVAEVTRAVRAGGGCGLCHPEIEEILAEVHGTPVDPALARANRRVCLAETRARIEAALAHSIGPRIAALGARIEHFDADGLRVRVYVRADAPAIGAASRAIRERLAALVCAELEVTVEAQAADGGALR
jgi:NifU-like protein